MEDRFQRPVQTPVQTSQATRVSSGFAELVDGQVKPTGLGLEAAAALGHVG